MRGRPSICSSIEQFAVTIANQKSCFSFLTKQPPMRVSQSNAANKRSNWHILRQVYISARIYRKGNVYTVFGVLLSNNFTQATQGMTM